MERSTARLIHQSTNLAFWLENPEWSSGNPVVDFARKGLFALPFSLHEAQKSLFFDTDKLIAVNGETVVVANGIDEVDKFMFRYPGKMAIEAFRDQVAHEVGTVTTALAGIALPTEVSIKTAYIFRSFYASVPAVVQTQERLDLNVHQAMDLAMVEQKASPLSRDRTARDLEKVLRGTESLVANFGYYPDISNNSGNVRVDLLFGSVKLIDVMPYYTDGNRLINDKPPGVIPHILQNIENYQEFVGQYGG